MANVVAQQLEVAGLVPVLRAKSTEQALVAAERMIAGGVTVVEVTMTVPGAIDVLRELKSKYGGKLLLGSGTVTDTQQCADTIAAGAAFVVSPSLHLDVIRKTKDLGAVSVPGALTPTEAITAWKAGADFVKIFPCSAVGGAAYIKALRAPFPQLKLIPTGGINQGNAAGFFAAGASAIGVGSDLVNLKAIDEGRPEAITSAARAYLEIIANARAGKA